MTAKKILVAEDDPDFRLELGRFLQQKGFVPIIAEDGYQALELAVRERPDLLILDVHMPAGDGFSVQDRVARHPEIALSPVIYMSHEESEQLSATARLHGAVKLFHKPFSLEELYESVIAALPPSSVEAA